MNIQILDNGNVIKVCKFIYYEHSKFEYIEI